MRITVSDREFDALVSALYAAVDDTGTADMGEQFGLWCALILRLDTEPRDDIRRMLAQSNLIVAFRSHVSTVQKDKGGRLICEKSGCKEIGWSVHYPDDPTILCEKHRPKHT